MSLLDARSALASVGLVVSSTEAVPSDQPQGTVLKVLQKLVQQLLQVVELFFKSQVEK
jgi:hypothetical protein